MANAIVITATAVKPGVLMRLRKARRIDCIIVTGSLVAKRIHRIEAHGGARGQITGGESDQEKDDGHEGEARRIVRGNSVETAGQKLSEEERADESDDETRQNQLQTLAGHEAQHVAGL